MVQSVYVNLKMGHAYLYVLKMDKIIWMMVTIITTLQHENIYYLVIFVNDK